MTATRAPKTGNGTAKPWEAGEIAVLRRAFATTTNRVLAERLGRTVKSIIYCAAHLGLTKSHEHRSKQSRKTARALKRTPEEMAALGSLGGRIGGPARAAALDAQALRAIALKGVAVRRAKRKPQH